MKSIYNFIVSYKTILVIIITIGLLHYFGFVSLSNIGLLIGCEILLAGFSIGLNNTIKPHPYAGTVSWIVFIVLSIALTAFFFTMGFE